MYTSTPNYRIQSISKESGRDDQHDFVINKLSTAFYLMCISITGLLLGPTSVGLLNDFVFDAENVRYSMSTIPLIFGIPVVAMIPFMRRSYLKEIEKT